jgi:hypothetical protein
MTFVVIIRIERFERRIRLDHEGAVSQQSSALAHLNITIISAFCDGEIKGCVRSGW